MHRDEIRKALRRVPFHPFKLSLADGSVLEVPHPEVLACIALLPSWRVSIADTILGPAGDSYLAKWGCKPSR